MLVEKTVAMALVGATVFVVSIKVMRSVCRRILLASLIMFPVWGVSKSDQPATNRAGGFECGTSASRGLNALVRARYLASLAKLAPKGGKRAVLQTPQPSLSADYGDIAVIEDDGTVLTQVNPFDLAGKAIRFEPVNAGAYRVVASSSTYDTTNGTPVALGDDDSKEVQLGFSFPFFGNTYDRVEVNSDGNLTFGQSDTASTSRDLARLLTGPPRIAPFFTDLNPDPLGGGGGSVSYRATADGMVFTWNSVSDYESRSTINSFNVILSKNGNIEFVYGSIIDTHNSVVGIAPGGGGAINAVQYSSGLPTQALTGAIAEVFSDTSEVSEAALTNLFLRSHPDEFDQVVVFLAFDFSIPGAFAYEVNTKNEIQGLGLSPTMDFDQTFGSKGRLKSFVLMGSLDGIGRFPSDPTTIFFRTYNTLEVLAHEVAHRWLAYPLFQEGANQTFDLLHATDKAHWSFFFNANASVMEGNKLEDRGADKGLSRFITSEVTDRYSELDRYLMGYGRKEDVPAMFLVQNPTGTARTSDSLPTLNALFGGTRQDFTIDAITSANGERVPSVAQSPKVYRQAFVLLTRNGQQVLPSQIAKLQAIRDAWVLYFNQQTGGLGYAVTNLESSQGTSPMQIQFPYFQGNSGRYTGIAVANWGTTPADVQFNAIDDSGNPVANPATIINPRMITIPPGAQIAMLAEQIFGLSLGDPRNGWIQANSSSSQVAGFFLDGDVSQNFLDGAVADNRAYANFYFTQSRVGTTVTPGSTFSNLIDVVNPSTSVANLTFTLTDDSGNPQGTPAGRTLQPRGRLAEDLSSLFPGISKPRTTGYVAVTSSVPVVGYQAIDTGTTVYSLPAQLASSAAVLYSAQFASGKAGAVQYFTDLNLVNTTGQVKNVHVTLVDNGGHVVSGIRNPVDVSLAPHQQLLVRGDDLFDLQDPATAEGIVEGSMVLSMSGGGVIGDVTFGDARAQKFLAALPLDGAPVQTLVFSQVAQGVGGGPKPYFTGIAVYNPNTTDVSLSIEVFSEQGIKTGSATLQLPAGGRISKTLPEIVPAITEQVRGYIRVTSSGGPVTAFELFGSQNLDFLTAVPAQPINP